MFKRFLRTLGAAPTANTQLGYSSLVLSSAIGTTSTSGSAVLATITLPTNGTWIVNASCGSFGVASNCVLTLSTTTSTDLTRSGGLVQQSYGFFSAVFVVTASTNINLVSATTALAVTVNPIHIYITRIG